MTCVVVSYVQGVPDQGYSGKLFLHEVTPATSNTIFADLKIRNFPSTLKSDDLKRLHLRQGGAWRTVSRNVTDWAREDAVDNAAGRRCK